MKLREMIVTNFGCIGMPGIRVVIDNIVALIGPNNVGKTTILEAYKRFAGTGEELLCDNFHKCDPNNKVEIVGIFSDLTEEDQSKVGKWLFSHIEYGPCIQYKWQWDKPNQKGAKFSWNNLDSQWQPGGMGGFDSIISSCVPTPLCIGPMEDYSVIQAKVLEILTSAAKERVRSEPAISNIIDQLRQLSEKVKVDIQSAVDETCVLLQKKIEDVFPKYKVSITPDIAKFEPEKIVGAGSHVTIQGPGEDGYALSNHGSGLQRAFIWAAIGALADLGRYKHGKKTMSKSEPRILLIEEPESFLHPPAVRKARESLYALAESDGWQVMVTTHSPIFIDVSKPHTTILRVEKASCGQPRIFSTDRASFEIEERDRLRMIRSCHPTVNEFFFADNVVLVEGETEHAVLNELLEMNGDSGTFHVVNCLGKANIPLFAKILNQFGSPYTILHDADSPKVKRKEKWIHNAMWTINQRILEAATCRETGAPECQVIAQTPDFEQYYFGELAKGDKPYNALITIGDENFAHKDSAELLQLVNRIKDKSHPARYNNMSELETMVREWAKVNGHEGEEKWIIE